ncbi:ABC transporter ATP-binding protein [Kosmotoga sp. DU53]|uniref:ABC transporter ATP-binding protein n=1 Tax=Kosmotoga sp. DU53 TaxID=1310160 RepID=UPI0007C4C89C|nr:ABC transporter ATP-binding protein [Kosmotoga sp. DU53]OAA22127.1 ABC transporter [Kosmotoga sp. DU53]
MDSVDVLRVESLEAKLGDFKLGPVSLKARENEIVALLGSSGCGKTLLLRAIAGLQEPSGGKVFIAGRDATALSPNTRNIAFVFQNDAIFPHLDTFENVAFPLRLRKDKEAEGKVVKKAQELDGLSDYLDKLPEKLPAGIRKLTAIARETVRNFELILMDEPFERLDRKIRNEMRTLVKKILMVLGRCVVIVLNDPEDAMAIADRVYVMKKGRFIASGNPVELYANPPSIEVMEIFSPLGVNRIKNIVFRPEDVEIAEDGEEIEIIHSSPYDSKKALCNVIFRAQPAVMLLPLKAIYTKKGKVKLRRVFKEE